MVNSKSDQVSKQRVLLGEITTVHGIRGDVVIRSYTADPGAIGSYGPLADQAGTAKFQIKVIRATPKGVIARVSGVTDRTAAEKLRGTKLYVSREQLPAPSETEYYYTDLIGLRAVTRDDAPYGRVVSVENFGAGDLLEIAREGENGGTEFVPFTDANVPDVNIAAGIIVVVPPILTGELEPQSEDGDEPASD